MMRVAMVTLLALALIGCQSYLTMIDGFNERQVQSCLRYQGSVRVGLGGTGGLTGVTATGGATLDTCKAVLGVGSGP